MKHSKTWSVICFVIWALQIAAEAVCAYFLIKLNMLPPLMLIIVMIIFVLLVIITGMMFFLRIEKPVCARRIIAAVLALAVAVAGCFAAHALSKLSSTVTTVTKGESTLVTAQVGVYVLEDDPAESIKDAADYLFAYNEADENTYVTRAIEHIEADAGGDINTVALGSATLLADALYNRDAQAVILDTAYADVLTEVDGYTDFEDRTRLIYEAQIVISSNSETTADGETASGEDGESEQSAGITEEPFLCYLSGSDTRSQMLTTSRSDVNIIAAVNPQTKQILFVNTPRDYFVENPAGGGALDKLTHCGIYGIDCSVQALENLYSEDIDYYAQINFTGFETLVDAVGGVTVYSDVAFTTNGGVSIQEGENYLNGEQALAFARERYALSGGDNDRGKNQMKVLTAVVEKLSAGTLLTNYSEILDSLSGMFITSISSDEVSGLVRMQLSDMAEWTVLSYAVTGTGGSDITYSMPGQYLYVMYPNEDSVARATELIDRLMVGEILTGADVN